MAGLLIISLCVWMNDIYRVKRVDSETRVTLSRVGTVDLAGIKVPEKMREDVVVFLSLLLRDKKVVIRQIENSSRVLLYLWDTPGTAIPSVRNGLELGIVENVDSWYPFSRVSKAATRNVNALLVRLGLAFAAPEAGIDFSSIELIAREEKVGLWALGDGSPDGSEPPTPKP